MIIKTMFGLGDCIYLRPIIRKLPVQGLTLCTCWPQVFQDLGPIKFIKPYNVNLRTQQDNINRFSESFWQPYQQPDIIPKYAITQENITSAFCNQILRHQPRWLNNGWEPNFDWLGPNPFPYTEKPICLIRPTTLRTEWMVTSRGPNPEYLQRFVDKYKDHYYIVSIANIKEGEEWYEKRLEGCDQYIENACSFEKTYHMFFTASLIVCSVSFWVPLALAMNKRTICIYGGHVPPNHIVDDRIRQENYKELVPKPFCACFENKHNCNKTIDLKIVDRIFEEQVNA